LRETRRFQILNRVFDKGTITRLAAALVAQARDAADAGLRWRTEFEVVSVDGTSYESERTEDVFGDDTSIDLSPTRAIAMHFVGRDPQTHEATRDVSIKLRHGADSGDLVIRGDEHGWVVATFADMRRSIESAPPQMDLWSRFRPLIFHATAIVGGFAVSAVIHLVFTVLIRPQPIATVTLPLWLAQLAEIFRNTPVRWFANVFLAWMQGLWIAFWIDRYLARMWPSIELDLGPEHLRVERHRRRRLKWVGSAIALPLLIRTVYDLVKFIRAM
jgi:hypothetical protein